MIQCECCKKAPAVMIDAEGVHLCGRCAKRSDLDDAALPVHEAVSRDFRLVKSPVTAATRVVLATGAFETVSGPGIVLKFEGRDGLSTVTCDAPIAVDELVKLIGPGRLVFERTEG